MATERKIPTKPPAHRSPPRGYGACFRTRRCQSGTLRKSHRSQMTRVTGVTGVTVHSIAASVPISGANKRTAVECTVTEIPNAAI